MSPAGRDLVSEMMNALAGKHWRKATVLNGLLCIFVTVSFVAIFHVSSLRSTDISRTVQTGLSVSKSYSVFFCCF